MENFNSTQLDAHKENVVHIYGATNIFSPYHPACHDVLNYDGDAPNSTMLASEILEDMAPEVTPPEPIDQVTVTNRAFTYFSYTIWISF
jgi:hypothetical protein